VYGRPSARRSSGWGEVSPWSCSYGAVHGHDRERVRRRCGWGRQPWRAAHERDYGWLSAVMEKHHAGDDTNVKVLGAGILAAYDGISVKDDWATVF
jgi:hypothetical protein